MLSLACVSAALERRHHDTDGSYQDECRQIDAVPPCIDAGDAFYLLNPDGDLAPTQAAFERWFASLRGWQARPPHCDRNTCHNCRYRAPWSIWRQQILYQAAVPLCCPVISPTTSRRGDTLMCPSASIDAGLKACAPAADLMMA